MLKAPFRLPTGFLTDFGYPGGRRFVALYWEPCGDEASYDDGIASACVLCDNWLYLDLIYQTHVGLWLEANGIHLGNSEEAARDWLVADALTGDVYAAARSEASYLVYTQLLTPTG
jgi:hypothetical protein